MNERVIFDAALEIADPQARRAFVEKACADNPAMLEAVESLLKSHDAAGSFLDIPVDQQIQEALPEDLTGSEKTRIYRPNNATPDDSDDEIDDESQPDISFLQPSSKPGSIGVLAHYEVLSVLGQGAFGIVFKAFDEKLHRLVAIKVMNSQLAATSPPRKRFLREARAAAAIRHENVVQVYSVEEQPLPYLVMEFIDGQTLKDKLDGAGPLETSEVLHIGRQIASGLAAAQTMGLIHRDIKPANILLEQGVEQRVKISDFGLARAADDASLTQSGTIAGTPMYMAPEQATGQALDHRADLFSFGSVLYQMACGRPPFRASNTVAVLRRVVEDTPRPLQEILPEIPDWLVTIVAKLHAKKPEDRFQSAKEVADLLGRCQSELQLNGKVTCVKVDESLRDSDAVRRGSPDSAETLDRRSPLSNPASQALGDLRSSDGAGSEDPRAARKLTAKLIVLSLLLGVTMISPILFGRHLSSTFNKWLWPAIPTLPATEVATGLRFDGKDDYVKVGPVNFSSPQYTLEAFVTSAKDGDNGVIALLKNVEKTPELMYLYDGYPASQRQSGAGIIGQRPYQSVNAPLVGGAREHRALVFDGSVMHYYVNGIWQGKRNCTARKGLMWEMRELYIGCKAIETEFFRGQIDQLRLSKIARYSNNFTVEPTLKSDDSTLVLYNFDEGQGDVLNDASGHGHHGQIFGATWVNPKSSSSSTNPVSQPADKSVFDLNCETAEWVHGRGATLVITPGVVVEPAAELPKTPFIVLESLFRPGANTTNLELDPLKRVRHLRAFALSSPQPPEGLFEVLQEQPRLYRLEIESAGIRTSEIARSKPWDTLLALHISVSTQNLDDEWRFLERCPFLQHLVVRGIEQLPNLLTRLSELPNLRSLDLLNATTVDEQAVAALQVKNPHLRVVIVGNWAGSRVVGRDPVRDAIQALLRQNAKVFGINYARGVPEEITSDNLNDATPWGVAEIHLEATTRCTEENQRHLASLESGQFLTLIAGQNVDADEWARAMSRRRLVQNFYTSGAGFTDEGLAHLQHASDVRNLGFSGTRVTRAGLDRFRRVHPTCTISSDLGKFEPDYEAVPEPISPQLSSTEPTGWHGWPADAPKPAIAPFDAEQAKQHQEKWAAYLKVPVEYTNSIGMKFRLIPPGEFMMGSTVQEIEAAIKEVGEDKHWQECIKSEAPRHKVILTQPIYLGVNEVTQAEYEKVMGVNPAHFAPMGAGKEAVAGLETTAHPVETVSWNDAAEFCAKLCQQEKLKPFYFRAGETITPLDGTGYRLPSEAEWEFACRAGTATKYWIGDKDEDLVRAGWFGRNSGGRTHAAGELKANPFGLYDIHGNVWEWAQDAWDATFYGQFSEKPAIDPGSPVYANSQHGLRCGSWNLTPSACRSSSRNAGFPMSRSANIGFRVCLPVDAVRASLKSPEVTALKKLGWHGWPADAPKPAIAPFNADQARQHQAAWAKYLAVPVEYTNSLGMKFRLIPPGEFLMGGTPEEIAAALKDVGADNPWQEIVKSVAPQHKVILTQPIYLGVNEVTQAEYEKVMGANPSHFAPMGMGKEAVANLQTGSHPVEMVSWNDAAEFCAKLSQQEKLKPFYFRAGETITPLDGTGYRLPTEAEWEFACRAGTTTKFWIGDSDNDMMKAGWFFGNSGGRTHAAGELKANPFGLVDIHGNVWEFVQDAWEATFYGNFAEKPAINPSNPFSAGSQRVVRGGFWNLAASSCRSSFRNAGGPTHPRNHVGFRVSLVVDVVRESLKVAGPAIPRPEVTTPSTLALNAIDFAAEREAAEWVLENKGTMSIAVSPDWQWRDYGASDNAKPLPSEPFVITIVDMVNSQVKTESDLERLTRCRYLEIFNISGGTVGPQATDLLTRLPRLKTLVLSDQKKLRTSALSKLGQISTVNHLGITSDMVDDKLDFVRHLPSLRMLNIYGPRPPDINLLAEAPQLRTILLTTPDAVDDAKLAAVQARHDKLRIVVGWQGKYRTVGRDPAHEAAKELVSLGVEIFGGVNYWQAPSKLLAKSDFEDGSVWSFDMQKIPATVQLSADDREKLKLLNSYHFTAEGQREADELAKSLSGNHGMASITMMDCDLTDAGLEHLQKLVSLRSINVSKTKVTLAGVERFHRAVPFCGITSDFGVTLPDFMSADAARSK